MEPKNQKGECVIVIEGKSIGELKSGAAEILGGDEPGGAYGSSDLNQGIDRKEAMKLVAKGTVESQRGTCTAC